MPHEWMPSPSGRTLNLRLHVCQPDDCCIPHHRQAAFRICRASNRNEKGDFMEPDNKNSALSRYLPSGHQAMIHFMVLFTLSCLLGPWIGPWLVNWINPPTAWGII